MRLRALAAVLLAVVGVTAVQGPARAGAARSRDASPPTLADLDRELAEALVGIAERNGGPGFGQAAARATGIVDPLENTDPWVALLVPDLDGDGSEDLLDLRYSRDHAPEFTMQARRGSDGTRLWRVESDRRASVPFVTEVTGGAVGIGLYEVDYTVSLTDWQHFVSSFDARGTRLFETELTEQAYGPAGLLSAVPAPHDVLPGAAGQPAELLLGLDTTLFGLGALGLSTATHLFQVQAMSLADGSRSDRGELLTTIGTHPRADTVGDLTDDDLADFVVLHGTYEAKETNGVVVARARDGTDLWTRGGLRVGSRAGAMSARDVTGDGLEDVLVNSMGSVTGPGLYIDPGGDTVPDPLGLFRVPVDVPLVVTLLEAAEGEVRWERPGLFAQQQDDLTGDELPDPMVWNVRIVDDEYEVVVAALTGLGAVVYESALGRLEVSDGDPTFFGFDVFAVGDLADDGVQDLMFGLFALRGEEWEELDGLADGRSGRLLRRELGIPLWGSLDGTGADLQEATYDKVAREGTLRVVDGLTGASLADLDVAAVTTGFTYLAPTDLDQDGCTELLMGTRLGPEVSDIYAFSTMTDDPLWALRRHDRGDTTDVSAVPMTSNPALCTTEPVPAAPPLPRPVPAPVTTPRGALPATGGTGLAAVLGVVALGVAAATRRTIDRRHLDAVERS